MIKIYSNLGDLRELIKRLEDYVSKTDKSLFKKENDAITKVANVKHDNYSKEGDIDSRNGTDNELREILKDRIIQNVIYLDTSNNLEIENNNSTVENATRMHFELLMKEREESDKINNEADILQLLLKLLLIYFKIY